jgi:cytochrome c
MGILRAELFSSFRRSNAKDCSRGRSGESRKSMVIQLVRLGLCGGALLGTESSVWAADEGLVENGRAIVEQKCARCHAIGTTGESPHPKALPFRFIVKRYPVEDLAEALAEGIVSGHPDMPVFAFEPAQINAILVYIDSLGRPAHDK